jgi:hypothetical protein
MVPAEGAAVMRILILVCLLSVAGCATVPPINNGTAAIASAIAILSDDAERAQWRGWIDADTETAIQVRLLDALDLIDTTIDIKAGDCEPPLTRNECAQNIILEIEKQLREAQP